MPVNALMAWTLTRSRRGRYTAVTVPDRPTLHCPTVPDTRVTVVIPAKDEEGLIGEIVDAVQAVRRRGAGRRRPLERPDARHRRSSTARASSRTTARARARRCGSRSTPPPPTSSSSSTPTARTIPHDIPALVAPISAGQADMVIGSRGKGGSDELHGTLEQFIRYVGSQLIMLGDQLPLERPADRQPERLPRDPPRRRRASSG